MKRDIKLGPDLWMYIHNKAKLAGLSNDCHKIKRFKKLIKHVIKNSPCNECKNHLKEFIKRYPIKKYYYVNDKLTRKNIGLFIWSWMLHNDVNSRLGKPIVPFQDAYSYYYLNY